VQGGRLRPAIFDLDPHKDVFGGCLGVLDEHVEVVIGIEHACVKQFVLELLAAAARLVSTRLPYGHATWGNFYRHSMYACVGVESRCSRQAISY